MQLAMSGLLPSALQLVAALSSITVVV